MDMWAPNKGIAEPRQAGATLATIVVAAAPEKKVYERAARRGRTPPRRRTSTHVSPLPSQGRGPGVRFRPLITLLSPPPRPAPASSPRHGMPTRPLIYTRPWRPCRFAPILCTGRAAAGRFHSTDTNPTVAQSPPGPATTAVRTDVAGPRE